MQQRNYQTINPTVAKQAAAHLSKNDPVLAPVVARAGICPLRPHQNYYWSLVDAIISQQLSVKAAASIEKRFQELFRSQVPQPSQILETSVDQLRTVGLSRPKANYIRDLADHIVSGQLELNKFVRLSNDEIIAELTAVKGIGEWTAHMFLMFCMSRANVLPTGDLGIRSSLKSLYGFDHLPSESEIKSLAIKHNWSPYESIASWYIWHNLDNKPAI